MYSSNVVTVIKYDRSPEAIDFRGFLCLETVRRQALSLKVSIRQSTTVICLQRGIPLPKNQNHTYTQTNRRDPGRASGAKIVGQGDPEKTVPLCHRWPLQDRRENSIRPLAIGRLCGVQHKGARTTCSVETTRPHREPRWSTL